jgi:hypothetical protein
MDRPASLSVNMVPGENIHQAAKYDVWLIAAKEQQLMLRKVPRVHRVCKSTGRDCTGIRIMATNCELSLKHEPCSYAMWTFDF